MFFDPEVKLHSYLFFNGQCREAMEFYKDCFGGELELQSFADSPGAETMPDSMQSHIAHATLITPGFILMASDMNIGVHPIKNAISLALQCNNPNQLNDYFERLKLDGEVMQELIPAFHGGLQGEIVDQFGVHWMFNCMNTGNSRDIMAQLAGNNQKN